MKKLMNMPEMKQKVSEAQLARFADEEQKAKFKSIHNSATTRANHSRAAKEWLADSKKKQIWLETSQSELAIKKRSESMKAWHLTTDDTKKQLRALNISKAKKAKCLAQPHVTKKCPRCEQLFTRPYSKRALNRVCCSKGCATAYRYAKSGVLSSNESGTQY